MIVLVTGASGLVGSAVARAGARRGHDVVGIVGSYPGEIEGLAHKQTVNLANETETTAAVLEIFPHAIVNCAAVSIPAECEAQPVLSQALNVGLPAVLARAAHHLGARFVHLSSDQVFDGTSAAPRAATDPTSPTSLYARQKVQSEHAVHAAAPDEAVTLRAPLLMGNSLTGRRSLHERLFADWAVGRTPRLFTDEIRQPCTAENLAEVIIELCEREDMRGVYHWAGTELASRDVLGRRIRDHFNLTERQAPILSVSRAEVPGAAQNRPPCLALDISAAAGKLKTRPQSLASQLEELNVPPPARDWYLAVPKN